MKSFRLLIIIIFILASMETTSSADPPLRVEYFPRVVKQGGICFVRASLPASIKAIYGEFQGERFPMGSGGRNRTHEGLIGVDMDTEPGPYELKVVSTDSSQKNITNTFCLKVEKTNFRTQTLSLPSSMVDLDPQTIERVNREDERLRVLFRGKREEKIWNGSFIRPVPGELTTPFGLRRIINGQQRKPHSGADLRAVEGESVLACNSGIVALVDQLFFSGKSVILDHGWGIFSMYFHLSEALVREGDKMSAGAMLGRVGSTGRSTGPHLHWGIKINGARVDPLSLLRLTEHLRE
jgi:murein DD-endopeptidase MepM/ murein hydrolase activator NlpD